MVDCAGDFVPLQSFFSEKRGRTHKTINTPNFFRKEELMIENTEQFKIVLDLAENKGRRDAENEMLESQNKQLEAANSKLSKQLNQKDKQLTERDIMIMALNQKIKELEAIVSSNTCGADGQKQVVYVNQYILLDAPKTVSYVCALDNTQKMFAGHLLLHTMADNTPKQIYDKVNEMTRLSTDPTERLIDTMEKVAERPVTQENIYGDKVGEKTVIPNVGNYRPDIQTQNMNVPLPPMGQNPQNLLGNE